jgi:hypothetical protein
MPDSLWVEAAPAHLTTAQAKDVADTKLRWSFFV